MGINLGLCLCGTWYCSIVGELEEHLEY